MFKYIKVFGPILIIWIIGYLIACLCFNKTRLKHTYDINAEDLAQKDPFLNDALGVFKHFKTSFIVYCVSIMASAIIPVTELRWIFFFICAMVMCPIVYDALYVSFKSPFHPAERMLIAIPTLYNIIIIAVTLFFHYFAYMHKEF